MKFSTTTILLAAGLGVSAHPSGHAHKNAHRSLEARREFVVAKKPVVTPTYAPPPPPASTPAPPPPPPASTTQPSSGSSSGSGASGYVPFCGNSKRATAAEIAYKGNVGANGKYGCNQMLIQASIASQYDYTITFTNKASTPQSCVCWNKIGPDGGINGFFKGNEVLDFTLAVGGSQVVAVDTNTQGGCTCTGGDTVSTTPIGAFAGTWVEYDMGNLSNLGWSGADASCLVAAAAGMPIPALSVCDADNSNTPCSIVNNGGTGTNAFLGGMEALDGLGLNLVAGKVRLAVTVG